MSCTKTLSGLCLCRPLPRCFSELASLRPGALHPQAVPSQERLVCLLLAGSLDGECYSASRKRRLNTVLVRNVGEQPRSFVHSPASLPAFQWAIQTSESLDKGRLCPPICRLHPALLLPPILPFSPSCCASSASLFSLAAPRPRIAQQVLSENRAGDVGRVKLPLFSLIYLSLFVFLSLTESLFCRGK